MPALPYRTLTLLCVFTFSAVGFAAERLERLKYNHPGLVVDLGVGLWAWPLPLDFDGDGDMDLLVSCPDKPYNGVYFFENPNGAKFPVFKPGVRLGPAISNAQISFVGGQPRVLTPGAEVVGLSRENFGAMRKIYPKSNIYPGKIRANQWRYADYDGDGALDLVVGVGDWADYGWDNAFNKEGQWIRGPLHGYVYLLRNRGATEKPDYEEPKKVVALRPVDSGATDAAASANTKDPVRQPGSTEPIDVFGMPSPNFADFDGDGDLDLLCGEFLDGFTYFENVGSRTQPEYAAGRRLKHDGRSLAMDLQMITPNACDWDGDGDMDLIVGDEDGRVALVEHTGRVADGLPRFLRPRYFQQEAADVKFGALVTPFGFDWDGDGDEDLICGNTAGYIAWIENLDGGDPPKWAAPNKFEAEGRVIRIQAGPNGSIQGPAEAKWGYTTLSVADWDHDDLPDIIVNSIWGKVIWFRNVGSRTEPKLAAAQGVEVAWKGEPPKPAWTWWSPQEGELATQWRTTPFVIDLNRDGLNDLVMLDHEGYLSFFERRQQDGDLTLLPSQRVFTDANNEPLHLNDGFAGRSGRRKLAFADWDGDGRLDLLANSVNADFLRNVGSSDHPWQFQNKGPVDDRILAGHTTSPTVVDWDRNNRPDLVLGGEDGYLYYRKNPLETK